MIGKLFGFLKSGTKKAPAAAGGFFKGAAKRAPLAAAYVGGGQLLSSMIDAKSRRAKAYYGESEADRRFGNYHETAGTTARWAGYLLGGAAMFKMDPISGLGARGAAFSARRGVARSLKSERANLASSRMNDIFSAKAGKGYSRLSRNVYKVGTHPARPASYDRAYRFREGRKKRLYTRRQEIDLSSGRAARSAGDSPTTRAISSEVTSLTSRLGKMRSPYTGLGQRLGVGLVAGAATGGFLAGHSPTLMATIPASAVLGIGSLWWKFKGPMTVGMGAIGLGAASSAGRPMYPAGESGNISVSHNKQSTVARLNYDTAGLTQALHNNRRSDS